MKRATGVLEKGKDWFQTKCTASNFRYSLFTQFPLLWPHFKCCTTEGIKIKRFKRKWFRHNSDIGLGRIWSFRQNHQHLISMKLLLSVFISQSGQKDLKTSIYPGLRASCPMARKKNITSNWRSSQAKTLAVFLPDRWGAWGWNRLRLAMLGLRQISVLKWIDNGLVNGLMPAILFLHQ